MIYVSVLQSAIHALFGSSKRFLNFFKMQNSKAIVIKCMHNAYLTCAIVGLSAANDADDGLINGYNILFFFILISQILQSIHKHLSKCIAISMTCRLFNLLAGCRSITLTVIQPNRPKQSFIHTLNFIIYYYETPSTVNTMSRSWSILMMTFYRSMGTKK